MSGERRVDPGKNGWDFVLIVAVLALCFLAIRREFSKIETPSDDQLLLAPGTQGMDKLWRDAVRPLKEGKDLRPHSHPGMIWDEPKPEFSRARDFPKPEEPKPAPEVVTQDDDYEVPPLPERRETVLPRLKLEPMKDTFMSQTSRGAETSAFLKAPAPPRRADDERFQRGKDQDPKADPKAARPTKTLQDRERLWRKPDAR